MDLKEGFLERMLHVGKLTRGVRGSVWLPCMVTGFAKRRRKGVYVLLCSHTAIIGGNQSIALTLQRYFGYRRFSNIGKAKRKHTPQYTSPIHGTSTYSCRVCEPVF
jgi:hypothetical protein